MRCPRSASRSGSSRIPRDTSSGSSASRSPSREKRLRAKTSKSPLDRAFHWVRNSDPRRLAHAPGPCRGCCWPSDDGAGGSCGRDAGLHRRLQGRPAARCAAGGSSPRRENAAATSSTRPIRVRASASTSTASSTSPRSTRAGSRSSSSRTSTARTRSPPARTRSAPTTTATPATAARSW